jgi:hypothetical protein
MKATGKTSSMMAVLMLAAAGANRTWAEPEVAGAGDPWLPPHPPLHRELTVRRLGDISIGRCWGWYYRVSPDGRHLATLEWGDGEGKKAVVTRDGVRGPGYDGFPLGCGCNFLTYSPDSAHLAYPAIRDGKCYVARDGAEEGPYNADGLRGWFEITFSPDSRRLAYGARRGGKPVIVVDGKIEEAPGAVHGIQFDGTSTRLAYLATLGAKMCVVVDGKPGRWCDGVCPATFDRKYDFGLFTPAGNRAVEIGRTGDTWTVSVEGRTPWTAKGEDIGGVRLSRDGARDVACNRNDGPAVFSPDGTRLGQWVQRGAETRPNGGVALVVDGKDVVTYRRRPGARHGLQPRQPPCRLRHRFHGSRRPCLPGRQGDRRRAGGRRSHVQPRQPSSALVRRGRRRLAGNG